MAVFFTSGEFIVKPGQDEQFFAAWSAAQELDPPVRGVVTPPRLLRDLSTPGRYVSFAEFESLEAIDEFRSRPDMGPIIDAMREHLDDVKTFVFEQVIAP